MKPERIHTEASKRRKPVFAPVLEEYPFQQAFTEFILHAEQLKAEHDVVHGLRREYISTAQLYPYYKMAFGFAALSDHSISYRLHQIQPGEFPDDFLFLHNDARQWEAKYFVNRLNHALLRKIYLPHPDYTIEHLAEEIRFLEFALHFWHEWFQDEEKEEDIS